MTVEQLRALLATMPDTAHVWIECEDDPRCVHEIATVTYDRGAVEIALGDGWLVRSGIARRSEPEPVPGVH
jgi:hypothetical protein